MADNYADADDDEQGRREELCWGVQEPGLLQELWVQVPISNHNGTMLSIMKVRMVASGQGHAIQCGHCENGDQMQCQCQKIQFHRENDFDCSESEFLGENCHLSELSEEGEGDNQLKVSKEF